MGRQAMTPMSDEKGSLHAEFWREVCAQQQFPPSSVQEIEAASEGGLAVAHGR